MVLDDCFGTSMEDDSFDLNELNLGFQKPKNPLLENYSQGVSDILPIDTSHMKSDGISDSEYWTYRGM